MSEDDNVPPSKPLSRKRKPQQFDLSDDDLAEPGPSGESNWIPTSPQEQEANKEKTKSKKAKKKEEGLILYIKYMQTTDLSLFHSHLFLYM